MPSVPERGYPLSALFVLMAACAVPMSMAAGAARAMAAGSIGSRELTIASLIGCGLVMLLGMILGLHHYRPFLGVIVGGLAGALLGAMAGPIVLTPQSDLTKLFGLALGGSAAMVAIAFAFKWSALRRRPPQPPAWFREAEPFQTPSQE